MVEDVITLKNLEERELSAQECICLEEMLCMVSLMFTPAAAAREVDISCHIQKPLSDGTVNVKCFQNRLMQVLYFVGSNLLQIAEASATLKFGISGVDDIAGGETVPLKVEVQVSGVQPLFSEENIFDAFKVRPAYSEKLEGTALGLSIARRVVEEVFHGYLEFKSYDHKSTACIHLSLTKCTDNQCKDHVLNSNILKILSQEDARPEQEILSKTRSGDHSDSSSLEQNPPALIHHQTSKFSSLCVLVADDSIINRKIIMQMLRKIKGDQEIHVTEAGCGEEAVTAHAKSFNKKTKFDCIFMDIIMPGMNGIQAATIIHTVDERVPIIFTSANLRNQIALGKSCFYLQKPFTRHQLSETLAAIHLDREE